MTDKDHDELILGLRLKPSLEVGRLCRQALHVAAQASRQLLGREGSRGSYTAKEHIILSP